MKHKKIKKININKPGKYYRQKNKKERRKINFNEKKDGNVKERRRKRTKEGK